ncbi:MAG: SDR family NAD(P)-dependent oxidoreductase [Mangrovibacterium sp.]|nr:SDR family NAD(P)-dependent oxidoreductase [Mangrovibacterium sp.]
MMTQKTAFITGATSGIGMETARILAVNHYRLVLTGRRKDRLELLKQELMPSCPVYTMCFDIRSRKEVDEALGKMPPEWRTIDVLINNAGLAAGYDPVSEADIDDWEAMIDTNVKGLLYISRQISRWMIERKSGHIIHISSVAGKEVYPMGSVYCATKHAVSAISKAMRIELLPHQIKVSTISPGAVETEFSLVRFKGNQEKADQVYKGFTPLHAKDIAESIYFVLSRPAHVNIDDLLIMPAAQASARDFFRKQQQ